MVAGLEIPGWVPTGEKIDLEEGGEEGKASEGAKEEEPMDLEGASSDLSKLLDEVGAFVCFQRNKRGPLGMDAQNFKSKWRCCWGLFSLLAGNTSTCTSCVL